MGSAHHGSWQGKGERSHLHSQASWQSAKVHQRRSWDTSFGPRKGGGDEVARRLKPKVSIPDSFQGKRSSEQDLKQVSCLCRKPKDSPNQTYPSIHQSCSCSPISGICYHLLRRPLCLRVWPGCVWPNLSLPQWGWGVTLHSTTISAIPQRPQITAFSGLFMWIKILSGKLYMQFSAIRGEMGNLRWTMMLPGAEFCIPGTIFGTPPKVWWSWLPTTFVAG